MRFETKYGRVLTEGGAFALRPRFFIDGIEYTEFEYHLMLPDRPAGAFRGGHGYPHTSVALATTPELVAEANAALERAGVASRHEPGGLLVVSSRADQRKVERLFGLRNKDDYDR